jgi:hypothetical protein
VTLWSQRLGVNSNRGNKEACTLATTGQHSLKVCCRALLGWLRMQTSSRQEKHWQHADLQLVWNLRCRTPAMSSGASATLSTWLTAGQQGQRAAGGLCHTMQRHLVNVNEHVPWTDTQVATYILANSSNTCP